MKIEKIKIENYKVYRNTEIRDLSNFSVFLGANGAGKSTLFDVFGFLSDALKANVKTALNKRGGYREVYSRDGEGPILFEIKFRNDKIEGETQPLITYRLEIGFENGLPIITTEILSYRRGGYGRPYRFLDFHRGEGTAIINEDEYSSSSSSTFQDPRFSGYFGDKRIGPISEIQSDQLFSQIVGRLVCVEFPDTGSP